MFINLRIIPFSHDAILQILPIASYVLFLKPMPLYSMSMASEMSWYIVIMLPTMRDFLPYLCIYTVISDFNFNFVKLNISV